MTRRSRLACVLALAAVVEPASADPTIRFENVQPPIVVALQPASEIALDAQGNVSVSCVPVAGGCSGMPQPVPEGPPPLVLSAMDFSNAPNEDGEFPPGTTVQLVPTVAAAFEVCVRMVVPGTPPGTGWDGAQTPPYAPVTVVVPVPYSTYGFQLRCFREIGGAVTSPTVTVATSGLDTP